MPHLTVKMYAGRSDADKQRLADRLTATVCDVLGHGPDAVSIAIEDVTPSAWMAAVYRPDIHGRAENLFKRPGYGPLA